METPRSRFPWWVPAGGLLLAAVYLPTLTTPFDFIDDGNLVYPSAKTSFAGHVELWWRKVEANYEHLGPFRPTLWVHWQLQANLFGGDPAVWRAYRLLWCGLAAAMLLWLFRELGVRPVAAVAAGALAMWNPYRNEIWTSLTLGEGVAMPYALFGLVAARKAATSSRPLKWEIASALAVLVAMGCKNVFAALVPAQIALRMWPDGMSLRDAWRRNGWRSLALGVTLLMPAAHFVYFKLHWHPGQYETHGPTLAQLGRILSALKGAMSAEFMAAGVVLAVVCVYAARRVREPNPPTPFPKKEGGAEPGHPVFLPSPLAGEGLGVRGTGLSTSVTQPRGQGGFPSPPTPLPQGERGEEAAPDSPSSVPRSALRVPRSAFLCAALLLGGGVTMYLPMGMISGRYAMPAVWGLDILFALLLTALAAAPLTVWKKAAWAGVCTGVVVVGVANIGRQEKFAARADMLWGAVRYVEAVAPPGARVAWLSGDSLAGGLNVEEGIHFQWHLYHRGRGDVKVGLFDTAGVPLDRVELPPLDGPSQYALAGKGAKDPAGWEPERSFAAGYWMGRKSYDCYLSHRPPAGSAAASAPPGQMAGSPRGLLP